ncbi:MAG: O-antigen ligase family protein [Acidimicrobiales bacterium]
MTGRSQDSRGDGSTTRSRLGAAGVLQIYVVLLILIPPRYVVPPLGAVGTPATIVGLGALLLWCLAVILPGGYLRRTVLPLRLVLVFLFGTVLASYAVLHSHWVPVAELLSSDRTLLQVLSWLGVALLAAEGLDGLDDVYRVLRTLVVAVAAMSIVGVLQFYAGINLADVAGVIPGLQQNALLDSVQARAGFRRPAGTATHPIEFGCVIAMVLPLALHLARFDTTRSWLRRWWPLGAIAMGVPVAVSRSAVLGAVVAGVIIFVGFEPKARPRALAAVAMFACVIYATTPGLLGTLRNMIVGAGSDPSITTRTSDYEVVAGYVQRAPIIGRGPGTFLADHRILDNQYLLTVIEIGLVGLFAVVVYLVATSFFGRGARHRTSDPRLRDVGQALAATGMVAVVTSFMFDGFSFLMYAGLIPLTLGLAAGLWALVRESAPINSAPPPGADEAPVGATRVDATALVTPNSAR